MVDENLTQQHVEPKSVFEIVAAAINEVEKMLRETRNVYDFNAYFKHSRGIPSLLRENKSVRPVPDGRNSDWAPEEYTRAKLATEPSGDGLDKDFIRHFLPKHSVASNSTLQAAITAYYQEYWQQEGDRLLEQSRLALWQGQEAHDQEKIGAAMELEKQARALSIPRAHGSDL